MLIITNQGTLTKQFSQYIISQAMPQCVKTIFSNLPFQTISKTAKMLAPPNASVRYCIVDRIGALFYKLFISKFVKAE